MDLPVVTLDVVAGLDDDLDWACGTGCRCLQSNGHDELFRILYFLCFQNCRFGYFVSSMKKETNLFGLRVASSFCCNDVVYDSELDAKPSV